MSPLRGKIWRRDALRALFAAPFAVPALSCSAEPKPQPKAVVARPIGGPVAVWSFFDLGPDDPRSRELSGVCWDASTRTLWAVQDEAPRIVALRPDDELQRWSFGESVNVNLSGPLDLEGLVVIPDGFIVCSEDGPRIVEIDREGMLRTEIHVPARFRDARANKSLESLAMSPSGHYLYTTSESALERDGAMASRTAGTRVRILRLERHKGEVSEHVYTTDPALRDGGDHGVADLCALSDDDLLVLERGWMKGAGNTARIYRVTLDDAASCLGVASLPASGPTLKKTLLADFATLRAEGLPAPKQPQPNPILDNYEGLTLGPLLKDGRPTVIVVSDDNGRSDQVARILVLAFG
jgi:hypothetical protein